MARRSRDGGFSMIRKKTLRHTCGVPAPFAKGAKRRGQAPHRGPPGSAAPTQAHRSSRWDSPVWPPADFQEHPAIGNMPGAYYPVGALDVDDRGSARVTRGWRAAGFSVPAAPEILNCSPDGSPGVRGHQPPENFGYFPSLESTAPQAGQASRFLPGFSGGRFDQLYKKSPGTTFGRATPFCERGL